MLEVPMQVRLSALCFLIGTGAFGQPSLEFEAASIRPAADQSDNILGTVTRGGPGSSDPERLTYRKVRFKVLLMKACGKVKTPFAVEGPAWMEKEAYDINATIPPGTTEEQFEQMLQNLLAERFGLKLHHENRQVQGYELVVAKNGPKFKESDLSLPEGPRKPLSLDNNGLSVLPHGRPASVVGPGMMAFGQQPVSALVDQLSNLLEHPVIDRTGLTGKYDMVMSYSPEGLGGIAALARSPSPGAAAAPDGSPGPPALSAPSIFNALQDQLGLRLEKKAMPFDVIVVDGANRTPSAN